MGGPINVGQVWQQSGLEMPQDTSDEPTGAQVPAPKASGHDHTGNGNNGHGKLQPALQAAPQPAPPGDLDPRLSQAERMAHRRRQRERQVAGQQVAGQQTTGQGGQGEQQGEQQAIAGERAGGSEGGSGGVRGISVNPLGDVTLDLIYELTHNQRAYRPDKESGGVNVSILHLPDVVGTAIERIQARIPARCGRAPICTACVEWGLKGLGQYPAVQRLLYLKAVFRDREEHSGGEEAEKGLGLAKGRSGRSLYGIRGQELHRIFRSFEVEFGGSGREPKEGIYMPLAVYTDLKDIACYGLGMELQDGALLTIAHTLVDIASAGEESTKGIVVEEDRLQMKAIIDRFLDHAQVRSEAAEALMMRWGMLTDNGGDHQG